MKVGTRQFQAPMVECKICGYVGKAKKQNNFNGCIYFLLLMLGIIPGLIYFARTQKSKKRICPKCDSEAVIPHKG